MSEAILRDATIKDFRNILYLIEKLFRTEYSNIPINENDEERKSELNNFIAESLTKPTRKILVIEKSGWLKGFFLADINLHPKIFKRNHICEIWMAYTLQSPIPFPKIIKEFEKWGKKQGCNALRAYVVAGNKRLHRVIEKKIGAEATYVVFEKDIIGGM